MSALEIFLVCLIGAIGALLRWAASTLTPLKQRAWANLYPNLFGSLLVGLSLGGTLEDEVAMVLLGLGGATTTFSGLAFDWLNQFARSRKSATYLLVSHVFGGISALATGFFVGHLIS